MQVDEVGLIACDYHTTKRIKHTFAFSCDNYYMNRYHGRILCHQT